MASMNADAVHFPKGVFPPGADFGKGGHVPMTHDGSGGVQRGLTYGSPPLGRLFWCFSARGRKVHFSTVGGLHGGSLPRPKNLFFKNASRRRSASTLLHRRWPPRRQPAKAKELVFQKRFPPTFGEYTSPPSAASTARACQGQRTYSSKKRPHRTYRWEPQKLLCGNITSFSSCPSQQQPQSRPRQALPQQLSV